MMAASSCTGDGFALWDAAYVLGSLPQSQAREFEAHLGDCAACREAVTELSDMPALLSLLDGDEVASIDVQIGVHLPRREPHGFHGT